ncbi:MAG: hypothetical protein WCI92_18550 [Bacteroidota bacterium]
MAQNQTVIVAVYCYAHAIRTYLRQEPLSYFLRPVRDKFILTIGITISDN